MKILLLISAVILFSTSNIFTQSNLTELSQLRFSAIDKEGKAFKGLTKDDISFRIGKTQINVESLENVSNKPLEVVIIIDTSPSQEKLLPLSKKIASSFVNKILDSSRDSVSIAYFADKTIKYTPLNNNFGDAQKDIDSIKPAKGNSYIWNSLDFILDKGFSPSKDQRKLIILLSDGYDSSSPVLPKELSLKMAKEKVRLYSFCLKDNNFLASTPLMGMVPTHIFTISTNSGGKGFLIDNIPKDEKINKLLSEIKENLLGDYAIRFSTEKLSNKTNSENINIKLLGKNGINLLYQNTF